MGRFFFFFFFLYLFFHFNFHFTIEKRSQGLVWIREHSHSFRPNTHYRRRHKPHLVSPILGNAEIISCSTIYFFRKNLFFSFLFFTFVSRLLLLLSDFLLVCVKVVGPHLISRSLYLFLIPSFFLCLLSCRARRTGLSVAKSLGVVFPPSRVLTHKSSLDQGIESRARMCQRQRGEGWRGGRSE